MIPSSLRNKILKMLHKNHSGMSKIKQMARRTVFWNGINDDIEDFVKACQICHQTTAIRKTVPYSSWQQTNKPFSRLHADFFHFQKKTFLVVVDSHSKWLELEYMRFGTDCRKVLKVFLSIFARFGLPDTIVTDGGPPFNSEYFKVFLEKQGIRVMKSPAYHPESNGQAERMVRLVKDVWKKFLLDPEMNKLDTDEQISFFLFNYRNTCLDSAGQFPSERLLAFKPKTLLDLINPKHNFKPNFTKNIDDDDKSITVENKVLPNPFNKLKNGDLIYYKNPNPTDVRIWLPAKFLTHVSNNISQISLGGRILQAHRRQLKILPVSRRGRKLVLHPNNFDRRSNIQQTNITQQHTKRRREDQDDVSSDSDAEGFFGFPADSFLFSEQEALPDLVPMETELEQQVDQEAVPEQRSIRRSTRKPKKRKLCDYVYF
ncbi:uncharacterized protein K02A2.6-like isoform X1 [Uranotaenia lowii]|uniref:uncharacterized protein K02A2.6-like isoform X1 n=1 Tax=Uranotaenia lowii TaxID=190385 RepID=UPI00247B1453|nr:uncharacterized protein K02A2.6-like isoform X1 [Uranotaenia lowii]XP_055585567.1 uncharacterized protein K02A2.6-like isoform X1 [Uranotaenia lowii]XP_055585568.1 uncharacterized protein K02A2.6-like isoform X1 [Uranotaenia lowii]XP_055585569.1 uncharacterized protein K02A2.6-like isoform X1 [Uranotaenia lowii]